MDMENINTDNIVYALANLPQLVFEITDACNLKCKYCGYGEFYDDNVTTDVVVTFAINMVFT
jgi:uncharacterized protein